MLWLQVAEGFNSINNKTILSSTRCSVFGWLQGWLILELSIKAKVLVQTIFLSLTGRLRLALSLFSFAKWLPSFQTHPGIKGVSFFWKSVFVLFCFFEEQRYFFHKLPRDFFHVSLAKIMSHDYSQADHWQVSGIIKNGLDQLRFILSGRRRSQPSLGNMAVLYLNKIWVGWQSRKERNGYLLG